MVQTFNGTLTLNTNDVDDSVATVALSGIWQAYSEHDPSGKYSEPTLSQLASTFGYQIATSYPGQTTTTNGVIMLGDHGAGTAVGQETLSS